MTGGAVATACAPPGLPGTVVHVTLLSMGSPRMGGTCPAASAMLGYRAHFKPAPALQAPYAILAAAVIAAETDAQAEALAASADLHVVRRANGEYLPLASPQEAAAYPYAPIDRERIARHRQRLVVGGIERVMGRLLPLIKATRADELMITTMVYDHAARRRSYELLAAAFGL